MESMKTPLVSIIIVNWNGGRIFENCLKSLAKTNYSARELIVVDNGSTDSSLKSIKSITGTKSIKRTEIIKNKTNLGFAKANNQGLELVKGKYILLLNNDTKVTSTFLSKLVNRMEQDSSLGVIQPKILLMDKPNHLDNAGSFLTPIGFLEHWGFLEKDGLKFQKERIIFAAKGACMLIRRAVINKVGLFDEAFVSYFEESDFCWRVWLAGFKVLYYPKAKIYHKVGFTIRRQDVRELNFHYYKNRAASLLKNLSTYNLLWILPLHAFVSLGIAALFLFRRQPRNATIIWEAFGWNLTNLPQTLRKRAKVQHIRVLDDKILFKDLMRPIPWKKFTSDFRRVENDLKRKCQY